MSPALLLAAALSGGTCFRPAQFVDLPVFEGTVTLAHGSFFGYIPPRAGDKCRIDWAALTRPKDDKWVALRFDMGPERKKRWVSAGGGKDTRPYVGAPGRFGVKAVHPSGATAKTFTGARFFATDNHGRKVTLDLALQPGMGDVKGVRVWVVQESHGSIASVALIEGRFTGKLSEPWITLPGDRKK
jgi:hypothetical protein